MQADEFARLDGLLDEALDLAGEARERWLQGLHRHHPDDARRLRGMLAAADDEVGISSVYSDGDDGRMPQDVGPEYEGAFRTPSLRCVAQRPTFMHSGLLHSLEEVVAFFNRGGDPAGTYPGVSVLSPLGLSEEEEGELVAFLRALDGSAPVPAFR
jgi:cytochrome c peroxidase